VLESRHDLHEGTEVVELQALPSKEDEKLEHFYTVHQVTLGCHTPHEEQRHLG